MSYSSDINIEKLQTELSQIMLDENNIGVDTVYTLEMYKEKINQIMLNATLKERIKKLLTDICFYDKTVPIKPTDLFKYDITIMVKQVGVTDYITNKNPYKESFKNF